MNRAAAFQPPESHASMLISLVFRIAAPRPATTGEKERAGPCLSDPCAKFASLDRHRGATRVNRLRDPGQSFKGTELLKIAGKFEPRFTEINLK
jgi:hypothetical protein